MTYENDSKTWILSATSALEYRFMEELKFFRAELSEVKSEVKSINHKLAILGNEFVMFNKSQFQLQSDIYTIKSNVDNLQGLRDNLQLDIIGYETGRNNENIDESVDKTELLERDKIKGNIRIPGIFTSVK